MNVDYPFDLDHRGRTAEATDEDHIRDLIEQTLFTIPGERVNRPDFGCGLPQLVFAPNSEELAAATQFLVQSSLQRWLGDRLKIDSVEVKAVESALRINIRYTIIKSQKSATASFSTEGPTP